MLGFVAAKQVVEKGRSAFFPEGNPDVPRDRRDEILREDDQAPQLGYVGSRYPSTRILVLAINPGNGPNDTRTPQDWQMMPAIRNFAENPTEHNFEKAAKAYMLVCSGWAFWKRRCAEMLDTNGVDPERLSFDQIAYTNCLPWRTHSGTDFSIDVDEKAANFYVRPLIEELEPGLIVTLGKRAASILHMAHPRSSIEQVYWDFAHAAKAATRQRRADAARIILDFAKLKGG
jgi:hypothetical protein